MRCPRTHLHHELPSILKRLLIVVIIAVPAAPRVDAQESANLVSTVIRGSTVYSPPELFSVYSDFLGKPISRESARSIATAIADMYLRDGYPRPTLHVDDRMAGYGVLAVEVSEARIAVVEVTGDPGPYAARLDALGRGLQNGSSLRSADLQTAVRRMRDLSGLRLTASTEPDEALPGSYRLNIDTDYRPTSGIFRLTNRGTDEIGPNFALGQVKANGMLRGRVDFGLTFGSAIDYGEYHGLGLSSSVAAADRLTIATSAFRSRSNPSELPVDLEDRYLRDRMTLSAIRALKNDATAQLAMSVGLRAEDLEISRAGNKLRDERLRLIVVGMRWTERLRPESQFSAGYEITKGINGMGSGLLANDLLDDPRRPDFIRATLDFARVARLRGRWSWRLNSLAQFSGDTLPYSERFKIGGDRLGRGFEVAEIAGDRGIGAKIELERRLDRIPDVAGRVSAYSFYDIGAAWKNDVPGRESAASAGAGLLLNGKRTDGRIEIAKPLTHPDVEGRNDLRVFVELTVSW